MKRLVFIFLLLIFCAIADTGVAQDENAEKPDLQEQENVKPIGKKNQKNYKSGGNIFTAFLSQFTLGVSTGYGATFYSHNLKGFGIYQPANGNGVFIFDQAFIDRDTLPSVYNNWVNNVQGFGGLLIPVDSMLTPILTNGIPVFPGDLKIGSDSIKLGYKSIAHNIPITVMVSIDVDRYRIGGGLTMELHKMGQFHPTTLKDTLRSFRTDFSTSFFKKYFGFIGITTYESWQYKMIADLQFGKINRGKHFNKELISSGLYFNFGYSVEKSLSEYFKVFVRPSVEWKAYTLTVPESDLSLNHRQPTLYVQFGATIRIPVLPRCPVPRCHIQMNHVHDGKEYRSKVHPIWKWQNPNYGQNYPQLIKYKRKNRFKLNPY